jgi:DNA-binding MarR family transcriptional regulator
MGQSARWFVEASGQVFAGMGAQTNAAVQSFLEERELEGPALQYIQTAHGFAPDAVTPQHFAKRAPYHNPEAIVEQLCKAVAAGWMEEVAEGRYRLTVKGQEMAESIFAYADELYGGLEVPVPEAELERLTVLLSKVVGKAKRLPEPHDKWALSWGVLFDRGPSAPVVVRLRRRLLDLNAFRDDVHIAAWEPYGVSGQLWEVLTLVWREEVGTAADLAEKLPYRGYNEASYAAALEELAARGWIAECEGVYTMTETGKAMRQEAEEATDDYYDAAWAGLSEGETVEIQSLMDKLATALQPSEQEAD